ncbi:MAG: hypothetical protein ACYTFT_11315 [Planctomycetota bacterium]|jgi:hypothetical protein
MKKNTKALVLTAAALLALPMASIMAQDRPEDRRVRMLADRIAKDVAEIRGLAFKEEVKKGIQTREELREFITGEFAKEMPDEEIRKVEKVYVKLGLMKSGLDLKEVLINLYTEQVAGFYNPEVKELFLIGPGGGPEQEMVMAHELVHALQDQHFDLYPTQRAAQDNDDRALALTALVEGDATLAMTAYLMEKQLGIKTSVERLPDVGAMFRLQSQMGGGAMGAAPRVITENMLFGYTDGATFCQKLVKKRGGYGIVTDAFSDLPESTEQVLHPEKYLGEERDLPIQVKVPNLVEKLGDDFTELYANVMGEFNTKLLFEVTLGGAAKQAAAGWGGDFYQVIEGRAGEVILVWTFVADTARDATEFANAYKKHAAGLNQGSSVWTRVEGKQALIIDGAGDRLRRRIVRIMDEGTTTKVGYEPLDIAKARAEAAAAGEGTPRTSGRASMFTEMKAPEGWTVKPGENQETASWEGPHGERLVVSESAAKGRSLERILRAHRRALAEEYGADLPFEIVGMNAERSPGGDSWALVSYAWSPAEGHPPIVTGELHLIDGSSGTHYVAALTALEPYYSAAVKVVRGANPELDDFVTALETETHPAAPAPAPQKQPEREPTLF